MARVALATNGEPQTTLAFLKGAIGEQKLAAAIAGMPDIKVLHDRSVPGTDGNIDLIVVGPAGVFVVDAKYYTGLIQTRIVGFVKPTLRLYVGRRDRSKKADNMHWQVQAVRRALIAGGFEPVPPIIPVLCFVEGKWASRFPPEDFNGVRLASTSSIRWHLGGAQVLDSQGVSNLHHALANAFPPK